MRSSGQGHRARTWWRQDWGESPHPSPDKVSQKGETPWAWKEGSNQGSLGL